MVIESGAKSTQPEDEEDVVDLTDKCQDVAANWGVTADRLWEESQKKKAEKKAAKEKVTLK